jgi:3-oxoacyl-[acyl-carrier protein] reductase
MTFSDRTCVVTGASRGIGRGIAEALGAEGANVTVNYNYSGDAARETVAAVEDAGGDAIAVQADVADRDDIEAMGERTHEAFGPVDVLVNNAGITEDTKFGSMTREDWDRVIDIKDRIREDIPLDRFAEIEEISGVVRFLASEDASYVTGEVINVNGAMDL